MSGIELFSAGSLGTCWYGKYHYLEPWVGCEHACPYCYARSRNVVCESLSDLGTSFARPALLQPKEQLLANIREQANSGSIEIVKLSRYTDILTPMHVKDGLSWEILNILAESKVQRVILTTKGLPDEQLIELFCKYPRKFSYNAAIRPSSVVPNSVLAGFDANLQDLEARLDAAAAICRGGVQTTIHMDPFVAQIDDADEALFPCLQMLKERNLRRVMWSYLLFSPGMMPSMEAAVEPAELETIMARYDFEGSRQVLPREQDTVSYAQQNQVALDSVDKVAKALMAGDFQFVLCSLKSIKGLDLHKYPRTMLCDGKFYA